MKRSDITPDQLQEARRFLMLAFKSPQYPAQDERLTVKWGDLAMLLAWYGALRIQGASVEDQGHGPDRECLRITRTPEEKC